MERVKFAVHSAAECKDAVIIWQTGLVESGTPER